MLAHATTFRGFSSCQAQQAGDGVGFSAFAEAAAGVESALSDLRAVEASLERQLGDLHRYRLGTGDAHLPVSDASPVS